MKKGKLIPVFGSKEGKEVISLLNELADEGLGYHDTGEEEENKMRGGLKKRQEKVVKAIGKEYNINLTNLKKEEVNKGMKSTKDVVKITETTNTKAVTPTVDLKEVEAKAIGYLKELETVGHIDGLACELETVHEGYLNLKSKSRLICGIKYRVCGDKVTYSLVARESYKDFSKSLQGKYSPGNWNVLFSLTDSDSIQKYLPIISASLEKYRKAKPVAKVAEVAVKKNKPIRKTI